MLLCGARLCKKLQVIAGNSYQGHNMAVQLLQKEMEQPVDVLLTLLANTQSRAMTQALIVLRQFQADITCTAINT